jgi:hypothetical protein
MMGGRTLPFHQDRWLKAGGLRIEQKAVKMSEDSVAPRVFISYSHDSPQHKQWVAELASRLLQNGVETTLDQWDLGLGDDLAKFMEHSLRDADRVLVVCTEAYVNKANDGEGGVGYEALIVTGEVISNLGTSRFIPIIKQDGTRPLKPICLETRFHVDLSKEDTYDEEFSRLLRELHGVPAVAKPPLGRNPFALTPSGDEIATSTSAARTPDETRLSSHDEFHTRAVEIARVGDLREWKLLLRAAKEGMREDLCRWRADNESAPPRSEEDVKELVARGLDSFMPLILVSLAGVESGRGNFCCQESAIDEILFPKDWKRSGFRSVVEVPEAAGFVFQALHGAIALQTRQLNLAINLAKSRGRYSYGSESVHLFKFPPLVGWLRSFDGNCTIAWDFLLSLHSRFPVLGSIFGDQDEYEVSLYAYYLALNILELAATLVDGKVDILQETKIHLEVPQFLSRASERVLYRAYQLLIADPERLSRIWLDMGVATENICAVWGKWVGLCNAWNHAVCGRFCMHDELPHLDLFRDLREKGRQL